MVAMLNLTFPVVEVEAAEMAEMAETERTVK